MGRRRLRHWLGFTNRKYAGVLACATGTLRNRGVGTIAGIRSLIEVARSATEVVELKVAPRVKFLASAIAAVVTSVSSRAAETPKFFVECHSFVAARDISKDYAYHLKAFGYLEKVANGIDINLDEENIVLSVDSRQSKKEEYSPLYPKLPLMMRQQQPCEDGKCKQVEYEPKDFEGTLVVTYDQDKGVIFIKHVLTPETSVQGRGGCLFVPLR